MLTLRRSWTVLRRCGAASHIVLLLVLEKGPRSRTRTTTKEAITVFETRSHALTLSRSHAPTLSRPTLSRPTLPLPAPSAPHPKACDKAEPACLPPRCRPGYARSRRPTVSCGQFVVI